MIDVMEEMDANVLTLTLNRPAARNAITPQMYSVLDKALARAESDSEVRAVLVQGSELAFTAGSDLKNLRDGPPSLEDSPVVQFSLRLAEFPKPIVAAVCGHAVGIGTTMLLHCDLIVAGSNARFRLPFVDLGICPEAASSLILPQMLGHQRASELLMLGGSFDASTALALGLVNRVVDPGEANGFARQWAQSLAAKPLSSLVETKRLMKQHHRGEIRSRIIEETHLIARMQREPAAQDAIAAFFR